MRFICLFLSVIFFCSIMQGQYRVPEAGKAFDDTELPRIDITMSPEDLDKILFGDLESNEEYAATFVYTTSYSKDTIEQVGFRLRGNTSRNAAKKSFKVSFNTFVRGQKWEGLEKMNLNGEHNDPSIMRSKLSWDSYRAMGVPASRCNHVEFYINGDYRGLYVNVEHIDETFLKKRFQNEDGNMYKCLWPADMVYKGSDPDLYKEEFWGRKAYGLKTNTIKDDYSDIAHLIDVLNNWDGVEQLCELEHILDVDALIRCMALDVLIGNWDGAFLNKNNFYLYNDPVLGRFTFIPYDLDNTFGIDWFQVDWATSPVYSWSDISGEERPLFETILGIPEFRDRYSRYLELAMETIFDPQEIANYVWGKITMLSDARSRDDFASLDYGFELDDFLVSADEGFGDHVPYGINQYVNRRHASVNAQISDFIAIPAVKEVSYKKSHDEVLFNIVMEETMDLGTVNLYTSIDGEMEETWVVDLVDGVGQQAVRFDQEGELIEYYISFEYGVGVLRHFPFCKDGKVRLVPLEQHDLVINEFVASNLNGKTDDAGENDDWVELYNAGGQRLDLSDFYLTERRDDPGKWRLPEGQLYPGEYKVIWVDDDGEQGEAHANFKLSKSGEFLGLYQGPLHGYFPVDTMTFTEQTTDLSSARMPNGTGDFVVTDKITFSSNNNEPSGLHDISENQNLIYPNPADQAIYFLNALKEQSELRIYNSQGQLVISEKVTENSINLSGLPAGTYTLRMIVNGKAKWQKFVKQ